MNSGTGLARAPQGPTARLARTGGRGGPRARPPVLRSVPEGKDALKSSEGGVPAGKGPDTSTSDGPKPSAFDPVETIAWGGTLPSRRRLATSLTLGSAVALGGNLFGVTSGLLSLDGGKFAAQTRLDVTVPVNGFNRCVDYDAGFEFKYPAKWLADQTIARRKAMRMEQSLDPPSLARQRQRRQQAAEPQAAFGPPGSDGEQNVSVIVAPIYAGFSLSKMGSPESVASRFLETIAPPRSNREANLLSASAKTDEVGNVYYVAEYTVKGPNFNRHNVSVYAGRNDFLYTYNAQCGIEDWETLREQFLQSADSFRIINSGLAKGGPDFPDRL